MPDNNAQTSAALFKGAFPISGDPDALPVKDFGPAIAYYTRILGFQVESRTPEKVVLRRDAAVIGLAQSGADPEQVSCYFSVENLPALHQELTEAGVEPSALQPSVHNGKAMTIFFAKEPYGVCFCFGEPQAESAHA